MCGEIRAPEGRVVHRGEKLELRIVQVEAEGEVMEKEVVVHPGAVVILPLLGDERVALIRNRRLAVGRELRELPAGTLRRGEAPEACALRELKEETGYEAGAIEFVGAFFAAPGWSTEQLFAFVARDLVPGEQELDKGERIEVDTVPLSEVPDMIKRGDIVDAKTIAALGICAAKRGTFELEGDWGPQTGG